MKETIIIELIYGATFVWKVEEGTTSAPRLLIWWGIR